MQTVDDYIKRSFALNRENRCSSTIYGHEKNYAKYIKNKFGSTKLCNISSQDITLWQNNLQEKERLLKATIQKTRSILYTMFEDAIDDKKLLAK
ncbi:tyrosine-type recombinase/integrase [Poseidonibacter lekithochrous]|uniref:hypothetical protein n=1 Tax=Poseidonibacter lekithochrous TaxID=1904463 RepID=UPI000D3D9227|nr:hypothetical protein [Poseidonibacter lekithochrous]